MHSRSWRHASKVIERYIAAIGGTKAVERIVRATSRPHSVVPTMGPCYHRSWEAWLSGCCLWVCMKLYEVSVSDTIGVAHPGQVRWGS